MPRVKTHDVINTPAGSEKIITTTTTTKTTTTIQIVSPEICVICLDRISEKASTLPCRHDQFDFPCLGTWIQQQRVCPLCKSEVKAIEYGYECENEDEDEVVPKIFTLPPQIDQLARDNQHSIPNRRVPQGLRRYRPYNGTDRSRRRSRRHSQEIQSSAFSRPISEEDNAFEFRRQVYQNKMYSLHVGTNRISKYRNITPSTFNANPGLVSRAKIFIRRELSVFDFLNPSSSSFGRTDRRASNAEFLLEYIISILKSIDLKASTGQAEELLKDFLGRENARLFLHELEAWLRSPYERLMDWDRHVQYEDTLMRDRRTAS